MASFEDEVLEGFLSTLETEGVSEGTRESLKKLLGGAQKLKVDEIIGTFESPESEETS